MNRKYLDFAKELDKIRSRELTVIAIVDGVLETILKGLKEETGEGIYQRENREHHNYSVVEIS